MSATHRFQKRSSSRSSNLTVAIGSWLWAKLYKNSPNLKMSSGVKKQRKVLVFGTQPGNNTFQNFKKTQFTLWFSTATKHSQQTFTVHRNKQIQRTSIFALVNARFQLAAVTQRKNCGLACFSEGWDILKRLNVTSHCTFFLRIK